ncbi:MAG: putative heme utilization carrier protein HutX [Oleiphilaceae bacterium]|jgi:putative heme utilization carrier protein HutX
MEIQKNVKSIAGKNAEALLCALATWGNTTTIILHGGCVFEFKGDFPKGAIAEGFYNLAGTLPGFHGHIRLEAIFEIALQDKKHRGRQSYAFDFQDDKNKSIFKIFIGRNTSGELISEQVDAFKRIQNNVNIYTLEG